MGASPPSEDPEEVADRLLEAVGRRLSESFGLRDEWLRELVAESRPAVHALLFAASLQRADDPEAFVHHESLAMVTLLGRRAGDLGVSTSAVLALVPAIVEGLRVEGHPLSSALGATLGAVCMEGFVLGREDRLRERAGRRAAETIATLTPSEGVRMLVVAGEQDPARLEEAIEGFGRVLFQADARAAVVEVTHLRPGGPALARAVFAADETARTLGIPCVFSGLSPPLLRDAEEAGIETRFLLRADGLAEALSRVEEGTYRGAERAWIPSLRRLFARR